MEINVISVLKFSRDTVFTTYRDSLAEMVIYLPNIKKIDVVSAENPEPNITKFENHWFADAPIPKMVQIALKPEMLKWVDYARWDNAEYTCDWKIETFFLKDAINCKGHNTFRTIDENSMELTISGDLSIDTQNIPGIPKILARKIKPSLEKFIIALITPNFHKINSGIEQYLQSKN